MNILILGGTTEASALARALAARPMVDRPWRATLSLAGRTRIPVPQPIPCYVGGFGGPDGLAAYLSEHGIDALVDATHPFAAQMTRNAAEAAARTGTPLLSIHRPAWTAPPGGRWTAVDTMQAAAAALGRTPRRVLLTVGQKDLAPFIAADWHDYVLRSVDAPAVAPTGALVLTATGPFLEADERTLMHRHRIDALVTKNAGGTATVAKLAAAAALGIETIVVARPARPDHLPTVATAAEALAWLEAQAGTRRSE